MCFVADLLFLIKVFQKKLQSDSLTIVDIEPEAEKFRERMNKLSTGSLLGGWENEFKERYDEEANKFCGIKLWERERRRKNVVIAYGTLNWGNIMEPRGGHRLLSMQKILIKQLNLDHLVTF